MAMKSQLKRNATRKKTVSIKAVFKKIDMRAAIIFIAAHFASMYIYNSIFVNGEFIVDRGGFVLHMLQASVFVSLLLLNLNFKLLVAAGVTSIFYTLLAINWFFLSRWEETIFQSYFYDYFSSIIMTINLIVIYLLGKDSAIHLFNMLLKRPSFFSKIRLLFRSNGSDTIRNINLSVSPQNFKSSEISK